MADVNCDQMTPNNHFVLESLGLPGIIKLLITCTHLEGMKHYKCMVNLKDIIPFNSALFGLGSIMTPVYQKWFGFPYRIGK